MTKIKDRSDWENYALPEKEKKTCETTKKMLDKHYGHAAVKFGFESQIVELGKEPKAKKTDK